jgi:flagellar biosynthesis component FlhA
MSSFFVELWEGVFTPGPTPTLLKATNMSFAALQLVLLAMLLATYSIHCVVLSALSAGLWWSVNWFATELAAHQREEEAKKRTEAQEKEVAGEEKKVAGEEDSETEVETAVPDKQPVKEDAAEAGVEAVEQVGEVKQRVAAAPVAGTQSSVSTEDEWEKVSENENDKDK